MRYDEFAGEDRTLQDIETIFHFPLFFLPQEKNRSGGYSASAPVLLFFESIQKVFQTCEKLFKFLRTV